MTRFCLPTMPAHIRLFTPGGGLMNHQIGAQRGGVGGGWGRGVGNGGCLLYTSGLVVIKLRYRA